MNIIEEKTNPMLKRKELKIDVDFDNGATPSKGDMQEAVAKNQGVGAEKVEVINVFSSFGKPSGLAKVYVWDEKNVDILKKKSEGGEKMTEEQTQEQPQEEEKKEETQEEKKEETQEQPQEEEKKEETQEEKKEETQEQPQEEEKTEEPAEEKPAEEEKKEE